MGAGSRRSGVPQSGVPQSDLANPNPRGPAHPAVNLAIVASGTAAADLKTP